MTLSIAALQQTGGVGNGLIEAVAPDPTSTKFPAVNTITLAGQTMPGYWKLLGAPKKFGWRIQKSIFLSGPILLPTGDDAVCPKFQVSIWRSQDYAIFREVRKVLLKKPLFSVGGTLSSKALGIGHPELHDLGVTAVVVLELNPMVCDETGLWSCAVEFLQWGRPRLAPPKANTAIPDAAPPTPVAADNIQLETQNVRAERDALAAQLARQLGGP